jgi:pimeloyl-ACP methyl ester carboxylesterase
VNRTRRLVSLVAGLAVAAVALSGCGILWDAKAESAPRASLAPNLDAVPEGFGDFYAQALDWRACDGIDEGTYDCTEVTAPLDWADPDGGEIELAVIRRHADSGDPAGSLLTNPGGPGASGFDLIADSALFAVGEDLAEVYDVIGFDPRGVGRSTAVTCLDPEAMDAYLYDIPTHPRGTPEWERELTESNRAFAEACEARSGGILPFITTDNAARDLDLLRAVLGDETLNYLGYSYGTFLGATYAKIFPANVGRLVLDGAIDPSIPGIEVGTVQAAGFESALRAFMTWCLGERECPFGGTLEEALDDLATLLASVDRAPLANEDGRRLGADTLVTAIVSALYADVRWPYLAQALTDALAGDPAVAFALADDYNSRAADGSYLDNTAEAFRAYNCMDYPIEDDPEAEAAARAYVAENAPTIAPYWEGVETCADWPAEATGVRQRITADGAPPIVVVGTTNDPATPYSWSVALAEQLSSGVLVTRVGEGHTGFNKGNACVDDAVVDYLIDGTVPEDGLRCE